MAEKLLSYYQSTVNLEATIIVLPLVDTFKNLTNFILNYTQHHYHHRLMELLVKAALTGFPALLGLEQSWYKDYLN